MHDTTWWLERAAERFDMPEPALDRLVRRRDRRLRTRRLVTAVVGLGVSVVGVGIAVVAFRTLGTTIPASGGAPGAAEPTGGGWTAFVLPTLAIWGALAVFGIAVVAFGRLSARPAPSPRAPGSGPLPEGRPPGGPTTTQGRVAWQDRSEWRKGEAMATHVERLPARHTARNVWVTIGVLIALVLATGAGVLIGRTTVEETAPPPEAVGLATADVVQLLDAQKAALNATPPNEAAFLATFTPGAVITDTIADVETEATSYFGALGPAPTTGLGLVQTSEVIQNEQYAAVSFRLGEGTHGIAVFRLQDGKIDHQWILS